jgi:hypothetical protein
MHVRRSVLTLSTLVLTLVAALVFAAPADRRAETLESGTALLDGVTLDSTTPIADINADPDAFEGEVVQIEGTVVEICSGMGCWVQLQDEEGNALNVKVDDGEVDFRDHVKKADYMVAEGVFMKVGEHGAQVYIMEHGAMMAGGTSAN